MKIEQKEEFKRHLGKLYAELKERLSIKKDPKFYIVEDAKNAGNILGHSGVYDNITRSIKVNITDRHPKDVLRTFAHEVVHHWQNENGKLQSKSSGEQDPQYAQNDPVLRKAEQQAYLLGNMYFRDWEDKFKNVNKMKL